MDCQLDTNLISGTKKPTPRKVLCGKDVITNPAVDNNYDVDTFHGTTLLDLK
jgi:hypothetical protein